MAAVFENTPQSPEMGAAPVSSHHLTVTPLSLISDDGPEWCYLSDDFLEAWCSTQDPNMINTAFSLDDVTKLVQPFDVVALSTFFYEIFQACNLNRISIPILADLLSQFFTNTAKLYSTRTNELLSLFLEIFSTFDLTDDLISLMKQVPLDKSLMLVQLDPKTLVKLNVVTALFEKKVVKTNTTLQYLQIRFNLPREESEGYARFIVEIHSASYSPNNMSKIASTSEAIISLIGFFDLDPIRSLDIFLDIFSINIVANSQFFLNVLKKSPWWPLKLASPTSLNDLGKPGGNTSAAKLLGFKLKFYADKNEAAPENLMVMIAVLIKEKFISFGEIYHYLSPSDEIMNEINKSWREEMENKALMARSSALAMAAPLADDSAPSSKDSQSRSSTQTEQKKEEPTILSSGKELAKNQKVQLLKALLAVGAIWPSLFLLSKFPFLPGPDPEIADLIHRIINHCITPLYEEIRPFKRQGNISTPLNLPSSINKTTTLVPPKQKSHRRVLTPLKTPTEAGVTHRFFYDDWTSELKPISTIEDLQELSAAFLRFSGPRLYRDLILLVKLCRIGVNSLQATKNVEKVEFWYQYFRNFIHPSVSLIEENPSVINEIFKLIKLFSFETRYSLYGEWLSINKTILELKIASLKSEKATKGVMKRLSKTNDREMMRRLAKISHANPLATFTAFIGQVESYDNLGALVVDAARYFTDLSWDALPIVIMMQLTSGRGTVQRDGLNDRIWLKSLSSFTAKLCQRYSVMDSTPILLYIIKQLHNRESGETSLFGEIIEQMSGIKKISNLTIPQIEGLGGSAKLQKIVYKVIQDNREMSNRSAKRLLDVMVNNNILAELFVLLAQLTENIVFTISDSEAHLKVLSSRYDDASSVLHQFIDMINYFLPTEAFQNHVISVTELCTKYGIKPKWAFELWRKMMQVKMIEYDETHRPIKDVKALEQPTIKDSVVIDLSSQPDSNKEEAQISPWHPVLVPVMSELSTFFGESGIKYLDIGFYVTFWQLSLYDIFFSSEKYFSEEKKLRETISSLSVSISRGDNSREGSSAIRQLKSERDELSSMTSQLEGEKIAHLNHHKAIMKRLLVEVKHFYISDNANDDPQKAMSDRYHQVFEFINTCVLPRALHSPLDAIFCSKFIFTLHRLGSTIPTVLLLDNLFAKNILYGTLLTCSTLEAENIGLFFCDIFSEFDKWRKNENLYNLVALGKMDGAKPTLPGMRIKFNNKPENESLASYEEFRRVLEKWHKKTMIDIKGSLQSDNYMSRRNAITVLKNMISVFPIAEYHGYEILDEIENIAEKEKREDLKLSATALRGHLQRSSKDWIDLWDFYGTTSDQKEKLIAEKRKRVAARESRKNPGKKVASATLLKPSLATLEKNKSALEKSKDTNISEVKSTLSQPKSDIKSSQVPTQPRSFSGGKTPISLPKIPSNGKDSDDKSERQGIVKDELDDPISSRENKMDRLKDNSQRNSPKNSPRDISKDRPRDFVRNNERENGIDHVKGNSRTRESVKTRDGFGDSTFNKELDRFNSRDVDRDNHRDGYNRGSNKLNSNGLPPPSGPRIRNDNDDRRNGRRDDNRVREMDKRNTASATSANLIEVKGLDARLRNVKINNYERDSKPRDVSKSNLDNRSSINQSRSSSSVRGGIDRASKDKSADIRPNNTKRINDNFTDRIGARNVVPISRSASIDSKISKSSPTASERANEEDPKDGKVDQNPRNPGRRDSQPPKRNTPDSVRNARDNQLRDRRDRVDRRGDRERERERNERNRERTNERRERDIRERDRDRDRNRDRDRDNRMRDTKDRDRFGIRSRVNRNDNRNDNQRKHQRTDNIVDTSGPEKRRRHYTKFE